ncbi:MAG: hypothetical protein INR71_14570 [Terriglobus roseus]|nr:hypothetical protein [Terriglobus roseus]
MLLQVQSQQQCAGMSCFDVVGRPPAVAVASTPTGSSHSSRPRMRLRTLGSTTRLQNVYHTKAVAEDYCSTETRKR